MLITSATILLYDQRSVYISHSTLRCIFRCDNCRSLKKNEKCQCTTTLIELTSALCSLVFTTTCTAVCIASCIGVSLAGWVSNPAAELCWNILGCSSHPFRMSNWRTFRNWVASPYTLERPYLAFIFVTGRHSWNSTKLKSPTVAEINFMARERGWMEQVKVT